jgi:hypothetical protein
MDEDAATRKTTMTLEEKLEKAALLIEEVVAGLDLRSSLCPCCQRVTWENWPAKMANDSLSEIPKRLRRIATSDTAFRTAEFNTGVKR